MKLKIISIILLTFVLTALITNNNIVFALVDPLVEASNHIENQVIQSFNSSYIRYEGEQTGANVKSLMAIILTNNSSNTRKVSVEYISDTEKTIENINQIMNKIDKSEKYNVKLQYTNGYVSNVQIYTNGTVKTNNSELYNSVNENTSGIIVKSILIVLLVAIVATCIYFAKKK